VSSPLGSAITHWHGLLDDALAGETQAALADGLKRRGLYFGERPLCNVLRPRFLTHEQYRFFQRRCALLLSAFQRAHEAGIASEAVRSQFRLTDDETSLLAHDPGFPDPSPTGRIDAFYLPDESAFHLTENNGENPTGAAYNDALSEIFLALPVSRAFQRRFAMDPLPARHGVLHAILAAWESFSGGRSKPRIAILDWPEVPTYSEFVLFEEYFQGHGLDVVIADPRSAELRGGKLIVGGAPVDVIYKRVLISELLEQCGRDSAVVRAVETGAVCMVNPFRCKLLHKKASLAVLHDERNASLFSAEQREAIAAHIPWTRVVEDRKTSYGGKAVDLLEFAGRSRERLVLKPNDAYGGAGIVLGWEVDDAGWAAAIRGALDTPHVVQERVPIPKEPFPSLVDGKVIMADRILDTDPFTVHGNHVEGCLSRLSTAALVNVTAGGGSQVPTFLVEAR
jgi:hypothetical protein